MSETPNDCKYLATHEWAKMDDDGHILVGITDHAQNALGDVVYVELPEPGQELAAGDEAGVVESVKAASDIYSPISGTVVSVNSDLEDEPEKVNADPFGDGWFFKVNPLDANELDDLLDAEAYQEVCDSEDH